MQFYVQVMTILEELVPKLNFVGMDCVEVSPPFDRTELTSQAAAGFVWTYLCAKIASEAAKKWLDFWSFEIDAYLVKYINVRM